MSYNFSFDEQVRNRISQHAFSVDGILTHPFEALHMGNGDLGASINLYPHELKITLAKADVWDARYDGNPEKWALKHDDLISMMKEKDRDLLANSLTLTEERATTTISKRRRMDLFHM